MYILLLPGVLSAQHQRDGGNSKPVLIGDPKAIEAGRAIFANVCAACHGPDGNGGRGPSLRERVYWHPVDDSTVYDAVQKGIAGSMPALSLPDDQAWQVVAYVRALTAPAVDTPLTDGDPIAGEELFWGRGSCGDCHRIRGRGGFLGPDLSNVGTTRSLPQIREAILDPDAAGSRDYRAVDTLLKSGMRLKGVVRDHTNYSLALQDQDGNMHLIFMKDVSELSIAKSSPMPKDYKQRLRSRDVEDLLAFLGRQSIRQVTRTRSPE